ncbi:MAG: histidinol-phosphate transaminase [Deltaproteobacteria bacterium]|nr:histidinol-phosphate transaminase [Deltaproteobacteria bacterium]
MSKKSVFEEIVNPQLNKIVPYLPGPMTKDIAAKYEMDPARVIKLSSNENPLGVPPLAKARIIEMAGEASLYPDAEARELRGALAQYVNMRPENIVVGPGSSSLMMHIIEVFSAPKDEVVFTSPAFGLFYEENTLARGRTPVKVSLEENFDLDVVKLKKALTQRSRVVFITRPNNPTSKLVSLKDLKEILQAAEAVKAIVVSDEAYVEFADPHTSALEFFYEMGEGINLLVTRTFSKAFGLADVRLGYCVGPAHAIAYLSKAKPKWGTGMLAQSAGVAALKDKEHLQRTLEVVRKGREYLHRELGRLGLEMVDAPQGNYVTARVSDFGFTAEEFTEELCRRGGIMIRGDFHPEYVRISIGTMPQNEVVTQTVAAMIKGRKRG